jgi:hypothetical protein
VIRFSVGLLESSKHEAIFVGTLFFPIVNCTWDLPTITCNMGERDDDRDEPAPLNISPYFLLHMEWLSSGLSDLLDLLSVTATWGYAAFQSQCSAVYDWGHRQDEPIFQDCLQVTLQLARALNRPRGISETALLELHERYPSSGALWLHATVACFKPLMLRCERLDSLWRPCLIATRPFRHCFDETIEARFLQEEQPQPWILEVGSRPADVDVERQSFINIRNHSASNWSYQPRSEDENRRSSSPPSSPPATPDGFVCPITQDIMSEPVLASDGMYYERDGIEQWIREGGSSPCTREVLRIEDLQPAPRLQAEIRRWRSRHRENE